MSVRAPACTDPVRGPVELVGDVDQGWWYLDEDEALRREILAEINRLSEPLARRRYNHREVMEAHRDKVDYREWRARSNRGQVPLVICQQGGEKVLQELVENRRFKSYSRFYGGVTSTLQFSTNDLPQPRGLSLRQMVASMLWRVVGVKKSKIKRSRPVMGALPH